MAAIGLAAESGAAAVWAAGAAAIAGAVALQDGPGGRLPQVIAASMQMGAAVLLGALTSSYDVLFVVVVAAWCLAAGMQSALGGHAGLVATAASALLVIAPQEPPSWPGVLVPTALVIRRGMRSGRADRGVAAPALAGPPRRDDQGLSVTGCGRPKCRRRPRCTGDRRPADLVAGGLRRQSSDATTPGVSRRISAGGEDRRNLGWAARQSRRRRRFAGAHGRRRCFSTRWPATATPHDGTPSMPLSASMPRSSSSGAKKRRPHNGCRSSCMRRPRCGSAN